MTIAGLSQEVGPDEMVRLIMEAFVGATITPEAEPVER